MASQSSVTRRHRALALAGIAIVAIPFVLGTALRASHAHSAELQPVTLSSATAPATLADVVAADKPAVVTVTTRMEQSVADMQQSPQFGPGSPFDEFFRQFFGQNGPMPGPMPQQPGGGHGQVAEALGSGFVISSDGTIVTNNHVIDGATDIKVTLDDGKEYKAVLVGQDAKTDLAVLKIDAGQPLQTVSWGDSDVLRPGDPVVAIGNPFGIGTTVTSGVVSARGRDLHNGPYDDFIQVDAAINHGNSGGPLIDMAGHVVGINTAIYSPNGGNVGVGFAIPSDEAKGVVAALVKDGSIAHGYLGVKIQPVTQDIADALGLKGTNGALVAGVEPNTPSASAGIQAGDVIVSMNGADVAAPRDLSRKVADLKPGSAEKLGIWRGGKQIDIAVTIGDGNATNVASAQPAVTGEQTIPDLGLGLAADPSGKGGAVVGSLDPQKPAAIAGLNEGDIIEGVNQKPETTPQDVASAIRDAAKSGRTSVLLQVERDGQQMFVAVPFSMG